MINLAKTETLCRNWWAVGLRGLCAVVFGTLVFLWPGISLLAFVILFGIYALLDGAFAIISAVRAARREQKWGLLLLEGIVGIGAGVVTLFWPGITALALLYIISAWAIVTGIFEIIAAVELRKEIEREWLLALSGLMSIAFGVLLVAFPWAGVLAVLWLIGAYAVVFGILLMILAAKLRQSSSRASAEMRTA